MAARHSWVALPPCGLRTKVSSPKSADATSGSPNEHVQRGCAETTFRKRRHQRGLIHKAAARDIDQDALRAERVEHFCTYNPEGVWTAWRCEEHCIAPLSQLQEGWARGDTVRPRHGGARCTRSPKRMAPGGERRRGRCARGQKRQACARSRGRVRGCMPVRAQRPSRTKRSPAGIRRAAESQSPTARSATSSVRTGVVVTAIPAGPQVIERQSVEPHAEYGNDLKTWQAGQLRCIETVGAGDDRPSHLIAPEFQESPTFRRGVGPASDRR